MISTLLWLVTYSFHVTYTSVMDHKNDLLLFQALQGNLCLVSQTFTPSCDKSVFSLKKICKLQWKPHVTNIINVSQKTD